ncbi:hypothetical protein [Novosphingobium colocasiae]|uniref:Energy transducer TonB n=1 Tax=Novosphingobium colocasiae TaxID=1256513 RepID=A0A918UHT6_9SPHN|nr:hypothetical protein [Novosphingobium colocasiae]GGZ10171.1 hypothetical protein GCM10011614_26340 [Novosphingobium colocasiae]
MTWGKAAAGAFFMAAICHTAVYGAATKTSAAPSPDTTTPEQTTAPTHTRGVKILRNAPQGSAKEGIADPAPAPAPQPVPPQPAPPLPAPPAPEPEPPTVQTCERPFARAQVTDDASPAFTTALRKQLTKKSASVVVNMAQPFPVNDPTPAELVPWLNQVKASGGIVSVKQYCQVSRGFFSFLRGLFKQSTQDPYAAANGYDVVMHVDGLVGEVTQVEFKLRAPQ